MSTDRLTFTNKDRALALILNDMRRIEADLRDPETNGNRADHETADIIKGFRLSFEKVIQVESGDPGVAVGPPRQALVQAIRMAEDQQSILDLCDQLDRQFAVLRQELGERDKFRDEIYKPQLALLREQLTTWEALWEEVGQHIDRAAIGYNHPQIRAVFTENRRLSSELAALRAVAPPQEPT